MFRKTNTPQNKPDLCKRYPNNFVRRSIKVRRLKLVVVLFVLTVLLLFVKNILASPSSERKNIGAVQSSKSDASVKATWYESGHTTSNGERFNPSKLTCATWDYPFNTVLRVTHKNKSILVRVNDRGPRKDIYAKGVKIDLSRAAFSRLAPLKEGKILVTISVHEHATN
jgi:rare lipoprotein A (peptidoglycan hydrolase)